MRDRDLSLTNDVGAQIQQTNGVNMYEVEFELKKRIRRAGLTVREIAQALQEPPGTVAGRLNGFLPLDQIHWPSLLMA